MPLNFNVDHASQGFNNHGTITFTPDGTNPMTAGSCYISTLGHGRQPQVNGAPGSWSYTVDSALILSCTLSPALTLTVHGQPGRQDESYTSMTATVTMDDQGNITGATNGSITYPTPASDGTDSWTASATTGQGAACEAGA